MIIGVPKEIKEFENRVAIVPSGVQTLVEAGHTVLVEKGAGVGSSIEDGEFLAAGARRAATAREVFRRADIVVKVKEPQPSEYPLIRAGQVMFTYFHFAASATLTKAFVKSGGIAVAYETIRTESGKLPLLTPMSEIAGRMSIQEAAKYMEKQFNGLGMLLSGVPGVAACRILIIGGGVVGTNAAKIAAGLGAEVVVLDVDLERLRYLEDIMPRNVSLLMSNPHTVSRELQKADIVIGAVLVQGARAPVLVTRKHIKTMKRGSVIVDVAVDQGGCIETTRPTDHRNPTFVVDGVVHYCVTNMPGAVPRTSTFALTNATLPYLVKLASGPVEKVLRSEALAHGVNICRGKVVHPGVAEACGLPYTPLAEALG
ncbi:MAG: alanine dehydrogenase [Planctomycetota bacterium]